MKQISREEVLKITGWSKAKLGSMMQTSKIHFERVPGKTKPVPVFDEAEVLRLAGIVTGEAVTDDQPPAKPETALAVVEENPKKIQRKSKENPNGFNGDFFERIESALLLPHKIFLTVREAARLTNFSQKYIRLNYAEKINGRWLVRRARLDEIKNSNII